jgi:hypothetical protein
MRTFNTNLNYQSSVTLDGVKYKIKKLKAIDGNGFMFSIEEPGKDSDCIHLTQSTLKALYLLITEEKK